MRIVKRVLSTYSADNFGVCSALYELGGLVVMHDASGCNSTYNTHDEPRWYDMDSLVFISGLTEKNAIFGNDEKLIQDLVTAAEELHPAFIAVCGGPLPHIIGTDFRAVAGAVERRCGIPTFGFQTNGMDSYISGAGQALEALVSLMQENSCTNSGEMADASGNRIGQLVMKAAESVGRIKSGKKMSVNILGATPLDFSMNGSVDALQKLLRREGFSVKSTWAMGDTLQNMLSSADASVNLVVSAVGLRAAAAMEKRFGIPYVVGLPAGKEVTGRIVSELRMKAEGRSLGPGGSTEMGRNATIPEKRGESGQFAKEDVCQENGVQTDDELLIIGEPIQSLAMRETLEGTFARENIRIISPMHGLPKEIIGLGCEKVEREDELREACRRARRVIADPLYARLLPNEAEKFISLPHVAYSGRYYEKEVPVLIGEALDAWLKTVLS